MLGRGLEALIPPQGSAPRQAQPEPVIQAPSAHASAALPAQHREELLPPAQPAAPLMLHVHDDEPAPSPYVHSAPAVPVYDLRPESQGDTFASQPYRYAAPAEPVPPASPMASPTYPAAPAHDAPHPVASAAAAHPEARSEPLRSAASEESMRPMSDAPSQASPAPAPVRPAVSFEVAYPERQPEEARPAPAASWSAGAAPASAIPAYPRPETVEPASAAPAQPAAPSRPAGFVAQDIYDDVRQPHEAVFQIDIDRIYPNPHQPRKTFDDAALADLAASIREFGILQPLVVRKVEHETPNGTEVRYELIAGERRWRASKLVGLPRVPAIIRADVANKESLELAIIENLQREQLNAIEMARAYARLQDEFNMTQREVASRLGKSRETVANTLRLLDLPGDVQAAIEDGRISESHGRLLLGVTDPALQQSLFRDLLERQLTTRELRERVAAGKGGRRSSRLPRESQPLSPELQMLQERLASELGAPVRIQASGDTGKITISFYSREELSAILERLAAEADILL